VAEIVAAGDVCPPATVLMATSSIFDLVKTDVDHWPTCLWLWVALVG
jgi:hypothetical protein